MTRPLIGITAHATTDADRETLDVFLAQIVAAVETAGGNPVTIPVDAGDTAIRDIFAGLDGLLLSGGGDLDPATYGSTPTPQVDGIDPQRDRTELELARWALAEGKPVLDICRGLQVLNVANGGTLYRDISEHPNAQRHTFYPDLPYDLLAHSVEISASSRLAQIVGRTTIEVNSLHHQACQAVAPGLQVVARAQDGMIEALEAPEHPFALGIQWHPETLPGLPETQALFRAIVAASAQPADAIIREEAAV
jgi:putative glutamine amidotransferase